MLVFLRTTAHYGLKMIPRALLPLRLVVALVCLLAASAPNAAGAAEVVILKSADLSAYNQAVAGFKASIPPSTSSVEFNLKGSAKLSQEQVELIRKPDTSVLFAVGSKAAQVAKEKFPDIPVVFCMVLDPAQYNLKAPNMTGIRLEIPLDRQFGAMRSVLPSLKRIGVLYDPEKTGHLVDEARLLAKSLGLELIAKQVNTEKEVPPALRALLSQVEALWLVPDSTVLTEDSLKFVLGTALDFNVPVIGFSSELVRSGALIGLSVNYEDVGRQAGVLAKKILFDQYKPSSATVPPERVRLSLNLKTAKFLGITISPDAVNAADELY
jgi:putative ABC transport system substrate-binding protein